MSKLKLSASVLALLNTVVAFGEAGGYAAKGPDMDALTSGGLVQTGPDGDNDTIAVRALPAGLEAAKEAATAKPPAGPKPEFKVANGIPLPEVNRGGNKGKSIYPFEGMAVGASFFIPATPAVPEPWKSLASTATSATRRYDEKVLENGQPVQEEYTDKKTKQKKVRDKMRHTRVFTMREIKDGKPWGDEFAGKAGAGVFRTQ